MPVMRVAFPPEQRVWLGGAVFSPPPDERCRLGLRVVPHCIQAVETHRRFPEQMSTLARRVLCTDTLVGVPKHTI